VAARILIVEDNKANLELVQYLLTASGYTTLAAWDGREGVQIAREEKPDLIVCDLRMPGMDGYDVMRYLKKDSLLRHIPIVAVTAHSMPGVRDDVLAAGFDGYLSKPIDPETFVRTIENFLPAGLRALRPQDP
jgi:CheY-like chemotaxis protein